MLAISHQWLTPATLGAICGAVAQRALLRRTRRGQRLLEMRAERYRAYLGMLESLSRATDLDLRTNGSESVPSSLGAVLSTPGSGEALSAETATEVSRLLLRMSYALAKVRDGLLALKLVSSPEVLGMLEEYVALQRRLYSDAVAMIEARSRVGVNGPARVTAQETAARLERSEQLLHSIIGRMRQELGTGE